MTEPFELGAVERPNIGELPPDNVSPELFGGEDGTTAYQKVGDKVSEVPKAIAEHLKGQDLGIEDYDRNKAITYDPQDEPLRPDDIDSFINDVKTLSVGTSDIDKFISDAQAGKANKEKEDAQENSKYLGAYYLGKLGELDVPEVARMVEKSQAGKPFSQRFMEKASSGNYWGAAKDVASGVYNTFKDYVVEQGKLVGKSAEDLSKGDIMGLYRDYRQAQATKADAQAGAVKGIAGMAPAALSLTSDAMQFAAEPILHGFPPAEQVFDSTLGTAEALAHHYFEVGAKKSADFLGVNQEAPAFKISENVAPLLVPFGGGEATANVTRKLAAEIADAAPRAAAKVGEKVLGAAEKAAPGAVKVGAAVAGAGIAGKYYHVANELFGSLLGVYAFGKLGITGYISKVLSKNLGELANASRIIANSPKGVTRVEALQTAAKAGKAQIDEAVNLGLAQLPEDQAALFMRAQENPRVAKILDGKAAKLFEDWQESQKLQKAIESFELNKGFALFQKRAAEKVIERGLQTAQAAAIMGGLAGSSSPAGDTEAVPHGVVAGAAIGAAGAAISGPRDVRELIHESGRDQLAMLGEKNLAGDRGEAHDEHLKGMSPDMQRFVKVKAGLAQSLGKKLLLHSDADFEAAGMKGVAGFEHEGDVYINADALKRVKDGYPIPHEITHAIDTAYQLSKPGNPYGDALDTLVNSTDPEVQKAVADAKAKYEEKLNKGKDPADHVSLTPDQLKSEITADLGQDVLGGRNVGAFYGGKSILQGLESKIKAFFGPEDQVTPEFKFPVTQKLRDLLTDRIFEVGARAKETAKAAEPPPLPKVEAEKPAAEPEKPVEAEKPAEPEKPAPEPEKEAEIPVETPAKPVVSEDKVSAAKQGLRGLGELVRDINPKLEAAVKEAQEKGLPITTEDLVNHYFHGDFNDPNTGKLPKHLGGEEEKPAKVAEEPFKKKKGRLTKKDVLKKELERQLQPHKSKMTKEEQAGFERAIEENQIKTPEDIAKRIRDRIQPRSEVLRAIAQVQKSQKPFHIRFLKSDGSTRTMVARFGVKPKNPSRTGGRPISNPSVYKVYDLKAGEYRSFDADRVKSIRQKGGGVDYRRKNFAPKREEPIDQSKIPGTDEWVAAIEAEEYKDKKEAFPEEPTLPKSEKEGAFRYAPSRHDDALVARSIRTKDGEVFSNIIHAVAVGDAFEKAKLIADPKVRIDKMRELARGDYTRGYSTKGGKFFAEGAEADAHAESIKQGYPAASVPVDARKDPEFNAAPERQPFTNKTERVNREAERLGVTKVGETKNRDIYRDPLTREDFKVKKGSPEGSIGSKLRSLRVADKDQISAAPERDQLGFFSQLEKVADEKIPNRTSAAQIIATLKNNGVKPDEMKWTGTDDFLSAKQKKGEAVTKQELMQHIKENKVVVRDVLKGEEKNPIQVEARARALYAEDEADLGYTGDLLMHWEKLDARRKDSYRMMAEDEFKTKFGRYQEPGGEPGSYRELLLTLPEDISSEKFTQGHYNENNVMAHVRFNDRKGPGGEHVLHLEELQSDWHQRGRKQGYTDPELGRQMDALKKERDQIRDEKAESFRQREQLFRGSADTENVEGSPSYGEWFANHVKIKDRLRKVLQDIVYLESKGVHRGVPDAPFKTTWPKVSMRRMIKYAADNGYDTLAWTRGDVQNERYSLEKYIDRIEWEKMPDTIDRPMTLGDIPMHITGEELESMRSRAIAGEMHHTPHPYAGHIGVEAYDLDGREVMSGKYSPEDLKAHIGDQLVKDILDSPHKAAVITNADFKKGGSGMRGFYDNMLPKIANEIGKKFNSRVQDMTIERGPELEKWDDQAVTDLLAEGEEVLLKTDEEGGTDYLRHGGDYDEWFAEHPDDTPLGFWVVPDDTKSTEPMTVHSLPITDEMKKSVQEKGQPLFAPKERDLYHATHNKGRTIATTDPAKSKIGAVFFSEKPRDKEFGKNVLKAKVKLKNPFFFSDHNVSELVSEISEKTAEKLVRDAGGYRNEPAEDVLRDNNAESFTQALEDKLNDSATEIIWQNKEIVDAMKKLGYDGLETRDSFGGTKEYAAFYKDSIRQAAPSRGLITPGNINLNTRPVVHNANGTISTVYSASIEEDGKEILIPRVSPRGKVLTMRAAIAQYRKTGKHLGIFEDVKSANAYAEKLHKEQEKLYKNPRK